MIEGIEQIDSKSKSVNTELEESMSGGSSDCSREKILNVILLVFVFVLIGLFAYLFFTDRLIVGVENPFSKESTPPAEENMLDCEYQGEVYEDGESFPSSDGCNSCSCVSGEVVCTLMACEEEECIDTKDQCLGLSDGTECEMGVWCDGNGLKCGGGVCTGLSTGTCRNEVCEYLPD